MTMAAPRPPRFNPSMPVEAPPPLHLPPLAAQQQSGFESMVPDNCETSLLSDLRTSEMLTEALAEARWKRKRATELITYKQA